MKMTARQLHQAEHRLLYLFGEDEDALRTAADQWLQSGEKESLRLRLDLEEQSRFLQHTRSLSIFGQQPCRAIVRDAHKANTADAKAWQTLAAKLHGEDKLLLCAVGSMYKKSWHKALLADSSVACCEFSPPEQKSFEQWFLSALQEAGVRCQRDDALVMAARLHGLWKEARQWITRLQWYQAEDGESIPLSVMIELSGEYAPDSLDDWCHAAALREPQAVAMTHQLICHQRVSGLQMLAWLDNRFHQLLLFRWHQARRHPDPAKAARLFGRGLASVVQAARCWQGAELIAVVQAISHAEQALKGGSWQQELEIMEALVMKLCRGSIHDHA